MEIYVHTSIFKSFLKSCPSTPKLVKQHQSCALHHLERDRKGQITAASQTFTLSPIALDDHIFCVSMHVNRNLIAGARMHSSGDFTAHIKIDAAKLTDSKNHHHHHLSRHMGFILSYKTS